MGELVGIDPRGAHDLIRRMEAVKAFLGRTRPGLDAAIAEAGQDWAGRQGSTALHRAWAFLHESQHDLKWRIDTVEQLVPVRERGMLTATFPFGAESEARREAEQAAAAIRAALDDPAAVERAVSAAAGSAGDPAYAAALLTALSPRTFTRLLDGSQKEVLARAFASAERTGRLGEEWHDLARTAPPEALTALVSLAGQSGTFLGQVALTLLDRPEPGRDLHGLVLAYAANPLAFQQFLAEHPRETGILLATGDPALRAALDEALKPGAGADGLRERAWANVRSLGGG
ncbi:hypothetical protein [Nonomuraea sp. NPDC050202]|uniref:hypothetical protein n=1 Tax=Nonomuraea sp. NPDC050202 TaxID=3155035 RepID=UPI0033F4D89B